MRYSWIYLVFLFQWSSVALGEPSGLPIEAATSTNPASELIPGAVLGLLGLLGVALIVSGMRNPTRSSFSSGSVGNLFLRIRFAEVSGRRVSDVSSLAHIGHLRDLSLKTASFVSPSYFSKGTRLALSLDSLPNFPKGKTVAEAEVIKCRSLGGDHATFLIWVRFVDLNSEARYPLVRYLRFLTQTPRVGAT